MKRREKEILVNAFVHLTTGILLVLRRADRSESDKWGEQGLKFIEKELLPWLERKG